MPSSSTIPDTFLLFGLWCVFFVEYEILKIPLKVSWFVSYLELFLSRNLSPEMKVLNQLQIFPLVLGAFALHSKVAF